MAEFQSFPFTAAKDFFSEETRSQYVKGLSYTARDPKLAKLVQQWAKDGKVVMGAAASSGATGRG